MPTRPPPPTQLARAVRAMRLSARLSQEELAKKLGTCQSAISDLETGRNSDPTVIMLRRIARITGHRMLLEFKRDE